MSKDLKRKRLQWKANFSRSRPGPEASSQSSMPPPPPMPDFTGMVPNVHAPSLPRGFDTQAQSSGRATSPASDSSDEMDLESLLLEAQEEWQDIRNAYSMFSNALGDDFRALGPEFSAPINTPFGTALQYRTYGIAGIWLNFYMALIACHRAHPSMPPAAMVAVGFAAGQTAGFANEIGKIAAGIAPECSRSSEVSPGVGAALIESGTALFLAGVQVSLFSPLYLSKALLTRNSYKTPLNATGPSRVYTTWRVSQAGRRPWPYASGAKSPGRKPQRSAWALRTRGPTKR